MADEKTEIENKLDAVKYQGLTAQQKHDINHVLSENKEKIAGLTIPETVEMVFQEPGIRLKTQAMNSRRLEFGIRCRAKKTMKKAELVKMVEQQQAVIEQLQQEIKRDRAGFDLDIKKIHASIDHLEKTERRDIRQVCADMVVLFDDLDMAVPRFVEFKSTEIMEVNNASK